MTTLILPLLASAAVPTPSVQQPPFATPAIERRVTALLRQMTLDEKIGQLVQFSNGNATGPDNVRVDQEALIAKGGMGSILNAIGAENTNRLQQVALDRSRLKIPLLFGLDVIHGYRTIFPVPLALSATWDPELVQRTARIAAVEATSEGVRWTFSPMVDIARDARWGRIMEGAGEDPFLGSLMASAYVRGYQGPNLNDPTSLLACAKHYVAYGGAEGGRDYEAVDLSERTLREIYLPPFQAAVNAGVGTFMSGFNTVQGVPASSNRFLLTDVLRGEWGFRGFVVSDWASVGELIDHGVALNIEDAAHKGFLAGVDMDMSANAYGSHLKGLVQAKRISMKDIDEATSRVLRIKFALGLFERPLTDTKRAAADLLRPEFLRAAREAAERSFVLLRNQPVAGGKPLLPLSASARVALIGPLADSQSDMLGEWAAQGRAEDVVTLKTSLEKRLGDRLTYVKGTDIETASETGFAAAVEAAKSADVVVAALGESRYMSGEALSRTRLGLPGNQQALLKALVATGKPVVLVAFSGRPMTLAWEAENVPAILQAWLPGVQAGPALDRVLFGEAAPEGRLTVSMARSVGQMPLYYNRLNTGRPPRGDRPNQRFRTGYLDERISPLYPFGHGMTYTRFEFDKPILSRPRLSAAALNRGQGALSVQVTVRNVGDRAGVEVPQLYIRERGTSVARPVRELKGFGRVSLQPGESKTLTFSIGQRELALWGAGEKFAVEPAELTLWVAPNAAAGEGITIPIER